VKLQIPARDNLQKLVISFQNESDPKKKHVLYLDLVEESLTLVKKIAVSFCPLPPALSMEDIVQTGAVGLLKAIDTYEIQEKGSFKTYASKFIRGKILQYLRDKVNMVKPPREAAQTVKLVKDYVQKHTSNGNVPDSKTISKALNIPENKINDILSIDLIKNIVSLDQKVYSIDGIETLADRIQSDKEKNYEEKFENKTMLEYALKKLPKNEKEVICKFYIDGESKKNIAKTLNVSATQVSRLIKKALNKMYVIIEEDLNNKEE